MKKLKEIPKFENEEQERNFWANENSTDFIDWENADSTVLPNLKPTTTTISLRMPESTLNKIRLAANKRDIPYQSLIKLFLKERIDKELKVSKV